MAKVIKTQKAFFNGQSILLIEGVEVDDKSPLVSKYPEAFELSIKDKPMVKKPKKEVGKPEPKVDKTLDNSKEIPKEETRTKRK